MKPKIFMMATAFLGLACTADAQSGSAALVDNKVQVEENLTALIIEGDCSVVLTPDAGDIIRIEGAASAVRLQQKEGVLTISAKDFRTLAGTKIYVPALYISKVYMNGSGVLTTSGTLSNPRMKIVLGAEGKIGIKSTGEVVVEPVDEILFVKCR